ncbi:MAG: hypothetical protein IID44_10170, partial [Planctomycetes bacterium]|nr:hypothetical protein [Planctomycetota bacterium]
MVSSSAAIVVNNNPWVHGIKRPLAAQASLAEPDSGDHPLDNLACSRPTAAHILSSCSESPFSSDPAGNSSFLSTGDTAVASGKYLFTSESVSMGHPDKLADRISDGILDALLAQDPKSRVACETMVTTGVAIVAGEITTKAIINYSQVIRDVIREVGYTDDAAGINADTCAVMISIDKQSPDIAQGVDDDAAAGKATGAGDQGLMFGYACRDTPELMPLPIALSHKIILRVTEARQNGEVDWLRPDSKSQVTVEYDGDTPVRIDTVVVSTQHTPEVDNETIREFVIEKVIRPCLPEDLITGEITFHVN